MNRAISRLFILLTVLVALLVVWTSRWTVFDQSALQNNKLNKLDYFAELGIKRGKMLADNGQVLAQSVSAGGHTWRRSYPTGSLTSQAVGYANIQKGQFSGLEGFWAPDITNHKHTTLNSIFGPISKPTTGNDVTTTISPKAQALARKLLAGRIGSVVAIVPQTGAIPVMYSNPTYDNNNPEAKCAPNELQIGCLTNLATQGEFPPGSTFKVVTAAAGLDSGLYTPNSTLNGHSPLTVSGAPLENDNGESFGPVTLRTALTKSINTVFAQVGLGVGRKRMQDYMQRFGFYARPPLDLPTSASLASGERLNNKLVPVANPNIDIGRTAIGQSNLTVTPLQMGMVASTVADGGKLMKPHFVTKVVNPDGQVVRQVKPSLYHQVMKPSSANSLSSMMTDVVEEGTGQSANLEGLHVAGKTGTATVGPSTNGQPNDDAWFIGFAPVGNPKIAVAVVLPHIPNGFGGTYAAPVAAQMMKELLAEGQ